MWYEPELKRMASQVVIDDGRGENSKSKVKGSLRLECSK